jgi:hypothetical protein
MAKPKGKSKAASRKTGNAKPKTGKSSAAKPTKKSAARARPAIEPRTKTEACVALLVRPEGASLEELQLVTGWQPHSVRGLLSGTVKKIPGSSLTSEKSAAGRRYYLRRAPASSHNHGR